MRGPGIVIATSGLLVACASVRGDHPVVASGDFDGDGRSDKAVLVATNDRIVLTIHRALAAPQTLAFGVAPDAQDAVCALPVTLGTVPSSCEADDGATLPGCIAAPGKVDLSISDGACDAIHLYWDQDAGRMAWWRR